MEPGCTFTEFSPNNSWLLMIVPNTPSVSSVRLRILGSLGAASCLVVGLSVHRDQVIAAVDQLGAIPATGLGALAAAVLLHRVVHASMLAATLDDLTLGKAIVATEAHVGCANAMIGGSAVGTGVKVAMLRSWGVKGEAIAASVTATGIIPGIVLWAMAFVVTLPGVLNGSAGPLTRVVCGVALSAVVLPITLWSVLLRGPRQVGWIAGWVERARLLVLRIRLPQGLRDRLERMDVRSEAEQLRLAGAPFLGARGVATFACSVTAQLTIASVLLVALRTLGVGSQVSPMEVLRTMAMARVLGSLAPMPGGLGLLDLGLLGGLISSGASRPSALAAIAVFRALTYVLPMVTGPIALVAWRRTQRRVCAVSTMPEVISLNPGLSPGTLAELPGAAVA